MPAIGAVNITELAPSTTPANVKQGNKVGVSAGVASAVIFGIVFVVIVCLKRRMHRDHRSSTASSPESDSDDDSALDGFSLEMQRQLSTSSAKSLELPLWRHVDKQLKKTIKDHLVEYQWLSMGAVIGKGQFGMVHEALLSRDRPLSNDYGPVSHTKVAVKTLRVIGKGQFGMVHKALLARDRPLSNDYGEVLHTKVAVKTLGAQDLDKDKIESFLREGLIMKDFDHRNVLSLVGVSVDLMGIPLIILPFMVHGNLKRYIMTPSILLTVRQLLRLGIQVAEGMAYLAKHKFVHRDLAARNCMIDDNMVVKVADFGLSRDIYTKEYYASQDTRAKLPVKWMAIESLSKALYTTKSDVWSYGVLLWELLTRGAVPYPDVPNWEVRSYVQSGRRMEKPESCPPEVYSVMLSCWQKDPDKRPTFTHILATLKDILKPPEDVPDGQDTEDEEDNYNTIIDASLEPDDITGSTGT